MIGCEHLVAIETARLRLRTFQQEDLAPLVELCGDAVVMEYLGGPIGREAVLAMANGAQDSFLSSGLGKIAVERRSDGAFLGTCGLSREPWYPDDLEVGWRLRPEAWGHGYATEAGRAWIDHAFERLRADRVISVADLPNLRSQAVMARLGMRFDHQATLRDGGDRFEAVVYALTRAEWAKGRSSSPSPSHARWPASTPVSATRPNGKR